jgi:hypothetical protein
MAAPDSYLAELNAFLRRLTELKAQDLLHEFSGEEGMCSPT